ESRDLLQALLEAPPASAGARLQPIALRSTAEQRRHALGRYRLRTWFDTVLHHAERLLLIVTVAFFGYWFLDGPVRDWLHEQQQPLRRPSASAATARSSGISEAVTRPNQAVRLPSVHPGEEQEAPAPVAPAAPLAEIEHDFMAPSGRALSAPVAIPQQPTQLQIPAISLDTPVKEVFVVNDEWEVAEYAAGFLHATAFPGEGNTVLAGHAGIRGAVFQDLGALNPGDDVFIDAGGWRYHYRVRESKNVWPEQVEVLDPSDTPVLTMLTCTNWDTQRLVVLADLIESKPLTG
ncbi:MAG TPA: sortase, partial [Roseiflexaceae bacterium]|nr:sortase [Roseiflexaceae bacterium]